MKKIIFSFLILFISILNVKGISGTIIINRYDIDNKDRLEATLVGSKISVYKNNGLIGVLTIDENGTAKMEGLELGIYTVEERDNIIGYNSNPYTHKVYITEYESTKVVSWGSSVIEGNLIINKYYGEEGNYKLDNDAIFEVYHNDKLIKTLKPINGVISEKLEYGTYTIKQLSGVKYYDLSEEFVVKIEEEKDYKYDLYTEVDEDLNQFLDEKKDELLTKEEELIKFEKELNEEKNNLLNLKDELINKEKDIKIEKELIEKEKESLENLRKNINSNKIELEEKSKELLIEEEELTKLKNALELIKNTLNLKEENLNKLELEIRMKEESLNKIKDELNLLKSELIKKEKDLINKGNDIKEKEIILKEKEDSILKLQNKKEDVLVVEVPNTYKKNHNKLLSRFLISVGIILIILRKRKVTNH